MPSTTAWWILRIKPTRLSSKRGTRKICHIGRAGSSGTEIEAVERRVAGTVAESRRVRAESARRRASGAHVRIPGPPARG